MRWSRLLVLFISNWLVSMLSVTFLAGYAAWAKHWAVDRIAWLEVSAIIYYIVVITLFVSFGLAALQYSFLFKGEKQLKQKTFALVNHHWRDAVFTEPKLGWYTTAELDDDIADLHRQLQTLAAAAQQPAGEIVPDAATRHEIVKQERQRIARELHDSVSQQLFAMTMLLSALQESNAEMPAPTRKQLQQVSQMVHSAQAEMRALLLHLRPITLENHSLAQGIQRLFAELDTKVQTNFETRLAEVPLPKEVENHLFRIVQELLSNALRHAQATLIECELLKENKMAILRFIDNGIGFDVETARHSSGYGLTNVTERVQQMGGFIKIISIPGQGTVIEITIPLQAGGEINTEKLPSMD